MNGSIVVLAVALLAWGLLFFYLARLERRIKQLEKSGSDTIRVPQREAREMR